MLTKTFVPTVMAQKLHFGLLKNSQDSEAETEFFLTILTMEFASELNTKVVALQIFLLLSKYEPILIYVLGAMNFIVANTNSVLIIVCSFKFYFDPHLFFLHLRAIKFFHTNVMFHIPDGGINPWQS